MTGVQTCALPISFGGVAHAAHLGGLVAGIFYVRFAVLRRWPAPDRRPRRPAPREFVNVTALKAESWNTPVSQSAEELSDAEFVSREVDPILDKISAHGIQSLTDRERKILDAARKKMEKR